MRSIERLPEDIHNSVRSGVVICDLSRVVEELIFNSLDAGATKVSVAVGVGSYYVKVADNGSGIIRDDLVLLGERYATSKVDHVSVTDMGAESFHFRGEALRSISNISLLEIVTKARGKPNGYKKIIKNYKCLFLGINDDIQDMGTTVTARDIFYNQPVRRKHMESRFIFPRKVLDLIKMSMLRIALVHSNVCFKVVDMECNHELLCTGPSPSPLPILFSNFGIENSLNFYHVNVSDGSVKLSGYISGPCETLALKAIQYIYINSRFICKGPIHKLLNQLAAKFDLSNSWKPATDSHSEKQNRLHLCPTFVLNLNCPRSYYDIVNSERSKTTVEFKDWVSVLTFVETGIKRLWMENISHDMPVTSESGRKRRRNCRTSIDLSSPLPNKPSKKYQHIPDWEESPSSPGMPIFSEVKMHKEEISFLPDTDYISQSCNKLLADHRVTKNPRSSTILSPSSVFSPDHQFMAYTSGKQEGVRSNAASLDILPKFVNNVSVRSGISSDCLDLSDEIDINHGVKKSFLRSCSVRKNLPDRTLAASDESFEFLNDAFGRTNKSIDFDNCVTDDFKLFLYGREIQSEGSPLLRLSPKIQFDMPERSKFDMGDLGDSSFVFKNMLLDSPVQVQKYLKPRWTPIKDKQSIRFLKDDVVNGNFFENHYEFGEDTRHGYPTWRDDDLIESNLNTKVSWLEQDCSSLELTPYLKGCNYRKRESDVLHWDNCEDSLPYPSKSDIDWSFSPSYGEESSKNYSTPKLYDSAAKERGCGRPNSRERTKNRKKGSVRSHSAPPFFRGKKRFSGLSDSSSILSARSNTQIINKTIPCTETGNMNDTLLPAKIRSLKYSQKSSDHYQPSPVEKSVAECSFTERPSSGRTPEVIRIQNGASQKSQLIDKDSLECLDLKEIQDPFNPGMKWRSNCSPIAGGNNTQFNYKGQDSILDLSSYLLCRSGDTLVPKSIDKTSLEHAEVLSQVDKKFIAVVAERTLCVIDQHAADERIRLEELRHKVLSGEMKTITYLDDEKELVLPEIGYQLLHNYADQIRVWGWICNIHSHDTSSFTKNLDFLHRRPSVVKLLAVPCILGVNLTDTDLLEFLQQLADTDGSSTIPPSVHYVLNSKACRGAIMFGDTLLPSECSLIVDELKRTSLCFQCAHGRPTTVPLVNLDTLNNKIAKLGSKNSWHGLRQHELTLERMEQRLRSAC